MASAAALGARRPSSLSVIFGVILGTGIITARPSVGYPVVAAAGLALTSSVSAFAVFGTYGLIRGSLVLPISAHVQKFAALDWLSNAADNLRPFETVLLACVAGSFLA